MLTSKFYKESTNTIYFTYNTLSHRVGLLLPGIDNAVVNMHVGDKYHLVFSGENAFKDGRKSAPGIPKIPPGGELDYELFLEEMPGTREEFIADVE